MKLTDTLARKLAALLTVEANEPDIAFTVAGKTKNEGNAHQHWRERHRRSKAARNALSAVTRVHLMRHVKLNDVLHLRANTPGFIVVVLERVSPKHLDDGDNLSSAMKSARDGVADALGIDDGPLTSVQWLYSQRRGAVREHAIGVQIFIRLATS